mgnify:FL=1
MTKGTQNKTVEIFEMIGACFLNGIRIQCNIFKVTRNIIETIYLLGYFEKSFKILPFNLISKKFPTEQF